MDTKRKEKRNGVFIMQIFIRLKAGQEEKLSKTLNYTYKPKQKVKICLIPIPPFIEDPICYICKTKANYMFEDFRLVCSDCLDTMIEGITKLEKNEDTTVPLTEDTLKRIKFEWSADRERWYSIRGSGFEPKNMSSFLAKLKEAFITGKFMIAEAEYKKETKTMVIFN